MSSESNKSKNLFSDKFRYFVLMYVPVLTFCILTFYGLFRRDYLEIVDEIGDQQYELIQIIGNTLQRYLALIESDIRALSRAPVLVDFLSEEEVPEIIDSNVFASIAAQRQIYDQIILIDAQGNTVYQIDIGTNSEIEVSETVAPNRSHHPYFQQTVNLPQGALYVSDIELQNVDGQLLGNDIPTLRFATPLFNNQNERWGILLLSIDLTDFLGRINSYSSENAASIVNLDRASTGNKLAEIWLLNRDGFWTAGPNEELNFSFIYPNKPAINLQSLHPKLWPLINSGQFGNANIDGNLFSYIKICADLVCPLPASATSLALLPGNEFAPEPYWTIVSYVPAAALGLFAILLPEYERWLIIALLLLAIILPSSYLAWKLAATLVDIRSKEQELQRTMIMHEAFFERNPTIMFVKDLDGKYFMENQSCRKFTKTSVGKNRSDHQALVSNEISTTIDEQDRKVLEYMQPMEFNTKWEGETGEQYFSTLRFPMLDKSGRVIGIGGIASDITDQIQARKALRESETQFRTLLESAPVAVLLSNTRGRISLVNKRAEELFGYGRRELLSKSLTDILPQIDMQPFQDLDPQELDGKELLRMNSIFANDKFGNSKPVEVSLSATTTESGIAVTCLLQDVSDRIQLEAQLLQSQKMEAIGKLTGGMAHDFNNLLGIIIGNLDLAGRKMDRESPSFNRIVTAKKAAERGAELTKRMLAVARRQPLQPKPTDINSMIVELTEILPRTLGPDIEMGYDLTEGLPPVLVDPSGLENVLINLAINSRDAMPNGGKFYITTHEWHLTAEDSITIQDEMKPGSYVHVAVTDTGEGMSKETLDRAFEPFFTTKERGKGTGLGLAMIYGFAKQSGGNVRMYSEPGVGTTIDLFLPIVKGVEIEAPESLSHDSAPMHFPNAEKILVVDDEYELLEVAVSYLEEMGFNVLAATNAEQALRTLAKNSDVELLLTDIVMPGGMNGVELARSVREIIPEIKVLYTSGFPEGVIADKSGAKLDAPLVPKPYSRESLSSAIADIFAAA